MKKLFIFVVALVMVLSLTACGTPKATLENMPEARDYFKSVDWKNDAVESRTDKLYELYVYDGATMSEYDDYVDACKELGFNFNTEELDAGFGSSYYISESEDGMYSIGVCIITNYNSDVGTLIIACGLTEAVGNSNIF